MTVEKALANNSLCLPFPCLLFSTTVVNNSGFLYLLLVLIIFRTYLNCLYKLLFLPIKILHVVILTRTVKKKNALFKAYPQSGV